MRRASSETANGLDVQTVGDPAHPPVVLVHGTLDRAAGMVRLSRRLVDDHRVTRYDRRGYGRSRPHHGPFTMGAQIDDLAEVIRSSTVDAQPCVVFGHSFGGNVALGCADRYPELVAGVVVFEAPLSWEPTWPGQSSAIRLADADPHAAAERFMQRLIGRRRWERMPESAKQARRAEGPAMLAELDDLRRAAPWDAARVRVPVVALAGGEGLEHHVGGTRELASRIEGAEFAVVEGANHFGPNTHAEQVAVHIRRVVAAVRGS